MRYQITANRAKERIRSIGLEITLANRGGISSNFREFHQIADSCKLLQVISSNCTKFQTISRNFTMQNTPPTSTADIVLLDTARQRRHYIDLANAHEAWQEIKASWALEGIEVTDDNAMQAGRMINGDITYEQLVSDLRAKYTQ
jgi:hypothetical protein